MIVILSVFAFLLGAVFASFAGVVIYRIPEGISIVSPPSFCPFCERRIAWYDNLPILGFLILRGRCRHCGAGIGFFSFLLELLGGFLFLLTYLAFGFSLRTLLALPIILLLLIIAGIDLTHHVVYDRMQLAFFLLSIAYAALLFITGESVWHAHLIGGAVGFSSFLLIRVIGGKLRGEECLGMGDVLLMGTAGLLLGWQAWLLALLLGSVTGSVIELIRIAKRGSRAEREIPFCPYLVFGILSAFLFGDRLIHIYLDLILL